MSTALDRPSPSLSRRLGLVLCSPRSPIVYQHHELYSPPSLFPGRRRIRPPCTKTVRCRASPHLQQHNPFSANHDAFAVHSQTRTRSSHKSPSQSRHSSPCQPPPLCPTPTSNSPRPSHPPSPTLPPSPTPPTTNNYNKTTPPGEEHRRSRRM